MGYCDSGCEHLTSRHNCKKYKKGLAYSSFSSKSLSCSSHERCSECDKDHRIAELEEKQKQLLSLIEEKQKLADVLYPEDDEDKEIDCEEAFDHGRGQGIFEMCNEVSKILCPDN